MAAPSVSQSVVRLVQILELFERHQRPMGSMEICEAIGAPRSSAAALLRSMVDMSVLSLDRRTATYLPTARFARLAVWLSERFLVEGDVLDTARAVQTSVAETVTLTAVLDLHTELLLVDRGSLPISFNASPGQKISLWGTSVGTAHLSLQTDDAIAKLYERSERRADDMAPRLPLNQILARVADVRLAKYSYAEGAFVSDAAAIAVPLPPDIGVRPTIITVAGPIERIRSKRAMIANALTTEADRLARSRRIQIDGGTGEVKDVRISQDRMVTRLSR